MTSRGFPVVAVLALLSWTLGACASKKPDTQGTPRVPTGALEQVLARHPASIATGSVATVSMLLRRLRGAKLPPAVRPAQRQ